MSALVDMPLSQSSDDGEYDAFAAALYSRGALLRKLRELEREDEAQRQQEFEAAAAAEDEADSNDGTTLRYETFLDHQAYYDDYKHVNYKYIDFEVSGNDNNNHNEEHKMYDSDDSESVPSGHHSRPRLIIEQDRTVGKGGFVWDAGYILAEHVLRQPEWQQEASNNSKQPCSVIELGAGTGITGLMIAHARPDTTTVHLTDLPALQPLLEKNAKSAPNATTGVLEWGVSSLPSSPKYDVVLGADVVASIYCAEALAKTIDDLAKPETRVYLACRDRLAGSIEQFEEYMKQIFSHVERTKAESANKNPDVWVFYATGKRSHQ